MILAVIAYFAGAISLAFVLALVEAASRADRREPHFEIYERFFAEGMGPRYEGDV